MYPVYLDIPAGRADTTTMIARDFFRASTILSRPSTALPCYYYRGRCLGSKDGFTRTRTLSVFSSFVQVVFLPKCMTHMTQKPACTLHVPRG